MIQPSPPLRDAFSVLRAPPSYMPAGLGPVSRRVETFERLPGLFVIHDFISEEEERSLIAALDSERPEWKLSRWNGECMVSDR